MARIDTGSSAANGPANGGGNGADQTETGIIAGLKTKFDGLLQSAEKLMEAPDLSKVAIKKNRFGSQIAIFYMAAAQVLILCPEAFPGLSLTVAILLGLAQKLNIANALAPAARSFSGKLGLLVRYFAGELADAVDQILTATTMTLNSPATPKDLRDKLEKASQQLLLLDQQRKQSIRNKMLQTRKSNTQNKTKQKDLTQENQDLTIKNKFLSGEGLRPDDLATEPAAPPATKRRRASRKTS